jgi:SAM-dependent methyltransferase
MTHLTANNKTGECPVCAYKTVTTVFEIEQVPVYNNVLWPSQESARRAPTGNIRLGFCHTCGHLFNLAFDSALMDYTQTYENSLHFSPRFQSYADALAAHLVDQYDLHGKDIVEIGSGKGDFLRLICELGANRGVGFDPSYEPLPGDERNPQITFIQEYYSPAFAHYQADFICCRHVLEHVEFPRDFVNSVRESIGDRETVIYFEVPNAAYTLRDLGIWDLIYEHYSYFSAQSLARLFTASGFEIDELAESFGGQYLGVAARANAQRASWQADLHELSAHVDAFASRYHDKVAFWQRELSEMAGKRAVIWGGGSKGVTFLNVLNARESIDYVVDINPRKQGKYVAGTGQLVVAPDFLCDYRPEIVLVLNPLYTGEIRQMLAGWNLSPELRVVS